MYFKKLKNILIMLLVLFAVSNLYGFSGTVNFSTSNGSDLGATAIDGEGGSSDIAGVQIDIFIANDAGTATGGNIFYNSSTGWEGLASSNDPSNNGYDAIVIKTSDGTTFDFNGFDSHEWVSSAATFTVEGFKGGSSTGSVSLSITALEKKTYSTNDLPDVNFGDVDTVVIVAETSGNTKYWGTFDNFVFADAVASDTTPPTFENSTPSQNSVTKNSVIIDVDLDEAGIAYAVAVANGDSS
ncbi:MAG: hypothetical protein PQJ49_00100, partial [Sphaerochaetaceae bacterium]|nr:hypothetical protein [Sphaerochaetaceae bacterium]